MIGGRIIKNESEERASGPLDEASILKAQRLVRDIGEENKRGFLIVVERTTVKDDGDTEEVAVDGMVKVSNSSKKFILDIVFAGLGMDKKEIRNYLMLNTLMGSELDGDNED